MGYSSAEFDWVDYERYLRAERQLSDTSVRKALDMLRLFGKNDYPLSLNIFDLQALQEGLIRAEGRYPSTNSMNLLKNSLRHWFRYISAIDDLDDPVQSPVAESFLGRIKRWLLREPLPPEVQLDEVTLSRVKRTLSGSGTEPRIPDKTKKRLTLDAILDLILTSRSKRWKAIWAIAFDLAPRPGELCSMDYEDVHGGSDTWVVEFKREKSNNIERHELMTWLSHMFFIPYHISHPARTGPLFPKRNGARMDPDTLQQNIYDRTRRRNIEGYPYALRKAGSTFWERRKIVPVSSIRKRLGQKADSRVFEKHYLIHLQADYSDDVSRAQGRYVPDVEPYEQRFCIFCATINPPKNEPLYSRLIAEGLADSPTHCFRCGNRLIEDEGPPVLSDTPRLDAPHPTATR